MKTTIKKQGRVYRWTIKRGSKIIYGGYCLTKEDAQNYARIMREENRHRR